jgi:hypothetical protein
MVDSICLEQKKAQSELSAMAGLAALMQVKDAGFGQAELF